MRKPSTYLLGLALALTVAACGKKSDPTPTPDPVSAKTNLLTTPKWRITSSVGTTTFMGQTVTTDVYASLQSCQKDNFAKFNLDHTAVSDEGATKCSASGPQTKQGTWSFNTAETELTTIDPSVPAGSPGNTTVAEIQQLTATTLQVKTTTTQTSSGITVTSSVSTTYTAF
ncbi:hypothetical protein JAO73_01040 [Hymenobacter sp. BT523]|uniref:hypothetical protein n=1 Tax=Hymenobacter sp. BT523 TaxID=2795725 RepID=UPI0018EBBB7C|nr:hypothetical protein [Hymenobacter sp. BT523]MBJ6107579.1 hypothetical protein [Hymenobacter sp. BT523]